MRRRTIQIMEIAALFFAALFIAYSAITAAETFSYITIISDSTISFKDVLFEICESVETFGIALILLAASGVLHILSHVGK